MSFDQDIRSTGNLKELLRNLKRRIQRTELQKDEKEQLQGHVNKIRTQIDFMDSHDIIQNVETNALPPYDFIFEPDYTEVMIYQPFDKQYGDGRKYTVTIGSANYDIIDIGDESQVNRFKPEIGSYHYEPYEAFNGTTDFISIPTSGSLDLNQFSVACWFKTQKIYNDEDGMLVNKGGIGTDSAGNNLNYGLYIQKTDNELKGGFEEGDGTDRQPDSGPLTVNDGAWHFATITNDGIVLRLYLDGIQVEQDTHSGAVPETNSHPLVIGRNSFDSSRFFRGFIDEVRVWNNDLTASEVFDLYAYNIIPQSGAIVYSNTFGGSNPTSAKRCYYAVPTGANNWKWNSTLFPPSLKLGGSVGLNIGSNENQFIYYDEFGTDLDFTANNLSFGFWIYPTDLSNSGADRILMVRRVDSSNSIIICIDNADNKLFGRLRIGGVDDLRQYDTALTTNTWFYINTTCAFAGPTLSLKVNDNADIASAKGINIGTPQNNTMSFGSYGGAVATRDFKGYIAFPIWYKHSTVLTTAQRTSLFNYNTKHDTTKPMIWGIGRFG